MSLAKCSLCDTIVDTDSDCDAYIQSYADGREEELDACRCLSCRDAVGNEDFNLNKEE